MYKCIPFLDKIILFISSGKTSETINHVLDGIGDLNKELENSVLILTFGIGDLKGNLHQS